MKLKSYFAILVAVCLCGLLFSCSKKELFPFFAASKNFVGCDVMELIPPDGESLYGFSKTYDPVTGLINKVTTPLYSIVPADFITLDVEYAFGKVYFLKSGTNDTALIAEFNQFGRVDKIQPGSSPSDVLPKTTFGYTANFLTSITTKGSTSFVAYDNVGNVKTIRDPHSQGLEDVEYTYDYNTVIKKQFYLDPIRGWIWNTYTLAQVMGWLPELVPVNKRIHTKILFTNTDVWEDAELTAHQLDEEGRLVSYRNGDLTWGINWYCR
jgi:hypothetical protein